MSHDCQHSAKSHFCYYYYLIFITLCIEGTEYKRDHCKVVYNICNEISIHWVCFIFRGDEIKHLVTAATRGPNCLKDYIRIIKEYVKVLGKNNYV